MWKGGNVMEREYCPYCMNPVAHGEACPNCGLTAGAYTPSPHHLPPGTVLQDRYLVGRVLGEGGFGITYIGCDLRLELKIAIKEYFPTDRSNRIATASLNVTSYTGFSGSQFDSGKAKFLREAQTMARLDRQPNIVSVKDFFEANNTAYIVMEYIDGTTFKDLVAQRGGRLPTWELLHMIEPLFDSLTAMHELGLIHRDISPENLMLENGMVRLLDFGCARESAGGDATMTVMLRHGFAPIEQYQSSSGGQGPWSDVYALSATIYYCITGKKPVQAMDRLLEDTLTPPRHLGAELTEAQEKALLRGLNIHPRKRFQTVQEMHTALYEGIPGEVDIPDVQQRTGYGSVREESGRQGAQEEQGHQGAGVQEVTGHQGIQEETEYQDTQGNLQQSEESGISEGSSPVLSWIINHKVPFISGAAILLACIIIFTAYSVRKNAEEGQAVTGSDSQNSELADDGSSLPDGSNSPAGGKSFADGEQINPFKNAVRMRTSSQFVLMQMLESEDISAVIVPEGSYIDISEPMEITKPIQLESGACMYVYAGVTISSTMQIEEGAEVQNQNVTTVAGDGRLIINGNLDGRGILETTGGGSIELADMGRIESALIWLEQETDLIGDATRVKLGAGRKICYLTASEDELFKNAAHVLDFSGFEAAMNDNAVTAIVIDSSFCLESTLICTKPLLISEGCELTHPPLERIPGYTPELGLNSVYETGLINSSIIINRGKIELNGYLDIDEKGYFINYGVVDSPIYNEIDAEALILNMGDMNLQNGQCKDTQIFNTGSLRHEGAGDIYLDIIFGGVYNYGDFILAADNEFWVSAAYDFNNMGKIQIEDGALFINRSGIESARNSQIIVDGRLDNTGSYITIDRPGNLLPGSGSIENGLVVVLMDDSNEMPKNDASLTSTILVRQWVWTDDAVTVSTTEELLAEAERSDHKQPILITGNAEFDELELTGRSIIIDAGATLSGKTLRMRNGILRVIGGILKADKLFFEDDSFLVNEGGSSIDINTGDSSQISFQNSSGILWAPLDLHGGSVMLDHSTILIENQFNRCGNITLTNDSYFYSPSGLTMDEGFSINILSGDFAANKTPFVINGDINIEEAGHMELSGDVILHSGYSVVNNGELLFESKSHWFNEGSSIINNGRMTLHGWEWQTNDFGGEILNRGIFMMGADAAISGILRNEGDMELMYGTFRIDGTVENVGNVYTYSDSIGLINKNNWNGNALQRR